jgi:hypothetical protein
MRAIALQKHSRAVSHTFRSSGHARLLVGLKERDLGKISSQGRESHLIYDSLLLIMLLLHLLNSHIDFLLALFYAFWHDLLLVCFFRFPF